MSPDTRVCRRRGDSSTPLEETVDPGGVIHVLSQDNSPS